MNSSPPLLTIDGPSGAGKGTVSRAIAKALGWHYLDSGAIYRALAVAVLRRNFSIDDEARIVPIASELDLKFECQDDLSIHLDGDDITDQIQTEICGNVASKLATYPIVRQALLEKQRSFHRQPGLVADGRDMGTVVFPQAKYKIFLTASPIVRAERRYKQLKEKGINVNLNTITADLMERDQRDQKRSNSPLVMADDAMLIDSSELAVEEVVRFGLNLVK